MTSTSRADQVVHRVYLKTVSVLTEGRLTHYANAGPSVSGRERERGKDKEGDRAVKQDRWFNLVTPDIDVHKEDLQVYRSVSSIEHRRPGQHAKGGTAIPPLLVAFVLDTSDIPGGQALLWNRTDGDGNGAQGTRVPLDPVLGRQAGEKRSGIILERWTFQAR